MKLFNPATLTNGEVTFLKLNDILDIFGEPHQAEKDSTGLKLIYNWDKFKTTILVKPDNTIAQISESLLSK